MLWGCLWTIFSCSISKQDKQRSKHNYIDVIVSYLKDNNLDNCCVQSECYKVDRRVLIDTTLCNYATLNKMYYHTYVAEVREEAFVIPDSMRNSFVDFERIINMKKKAIEIVEIPSADNCFELISTEKNYPNGTLSFSPLIPYKTNDYYQVWVKAKRSGEDIEFKFYLKYVEGRYVVKSYVYDDYCLSTSVDKFGDYIK